MAREQLSASRREMWARSDYRSHRMSAFRGGTVEWSPATEQLILGTALGDGHLEVPLATCINARLTVSHAIEAYTQWKYGQLYPTGLLAHPPERLDRIVDGKPSTLWRIRTATCPYITPIYHQIYIQGKKQITPNLLEKIGPFALAVWYMDDGSLSYDRRGSGYYSVRLATHRYGYQGATLTRDWLAQRWGVKATIIKINHPHQDYAEVSINAQKQVEKFLNIVGSHVIPAMAYKVRQEVTV